MAVTSYVYRVWFEDGYGILSRGANMEEAKAKAITDMTAKVKKHRLNGAEYRKAITVKSAEKVHARK